MCFSFISLPLLSSFMYWSIYRSIRLSCTYLSSMYICVISLSLLLSLSLSFSRLSMIYWPCTSIYIFVSFLLDFPFLLLLSSSVDLSVFLSIYYLSCCPCPYVSSFFLSVCLSIHVSILPSINWHVEHLSVICLFIYLFIRHMDLSLSMYLYHMLSSMFIYVFVYRPSFSFIYYVFYVYWSVHSYMQHSGINVSIYLPTYLKSIPPSIIYLFHFFSSYHSLHPFIHLPIHLHRSIKTFLHRMIQISMIFIFLYLST